MHRPTGKQEAYNSEGSGEVEKFSIPDKLLKQVTWFKHYTASFSQAKLKDQQCIDLKIHHSFRVLGHAITIAESLGLDPVLTNLTHLAALFHDLGRFPQYARFRTFHDGDSTNHAKLSIDVLRESDVLGDLPPEERRLVLAAIFLHNRPSIPGRVSPQLNKMARIVRDADKLDIIAVMISYFSSAQTTKDAITLDLKPHPTAYTEKILLDIQSGSLGKYEDLVWVNDLKLFYCGWVNDLNFPVSRKIFLEKNHLPRLFGLLPHSPELRALEGQLKRKLFQ